MRPILSVLAAGLLLLHGAAFLLFLLHSSRIGGAALHGGEEEGRYWVASHGKRTEVTAEEFRRSRMLEVAVLGGLPLALAGGAWLLFAEGLPWMILRGDRQAAAATERRVLRSGPPLAEARTGGTLGWANFGGPMILVSVHPGGLRVKPLWVPPFAVERNRIRAVRRRKGWFTDRVEIVHDSPEVRATLSFEAGKDPGFPAALEGLAGREGRSGPRSAPSA